MARTASGVLAELDKNNRTKAHAMLEVVKGLASG